jgi:protein tyrosine/serine phosphatase
MRNFCVVRTGVLWRGEGPTPSDARWLVEHGVGTIVSLHRDVKPAFEAAKIRPELTHSVVYFRVQDFGVMQVLTHSHIDADLSLILAIIKQEPKPVFISCRAGVDRTGIIAAAYEMLIEGVSPEQAIAEMERYHSPWDPLNAHYLRGLTGDRKTRILSNVSMWEHRLRASGQFECRQGKCQLQVTTVPD